MSEDAAFGSSSMDVCGWKGGGGGGQSVLEDAVVNSDAKKLFCLTA